ncbi:unnamed protein product [Peronospora belbahrii]|nr:unnamed protein product [Peronospora belbahrii]
MTHHVLGDKLDVHTGGVDLRFPHHNNEIAQCEAHNYGPQCEHDKEWCKHFVHFGHLYIRGRKMSKSLKNFISVKDFLNDGHTADHFRLICLQFNNRDICSSDTKIKGIKSKRCEKQDLEVLDALFMTQAQVDEGLLDDLDTPRALSLVLNLISRGNTYLLAHRGDDQAPEEVLIALTSYVLEVLDLFGLEGLHAEFSAMMRRRFTVSVKKQQLNERDELVSRDEQEALLYSLIKFRAAVREEALRNLNQSGNMRILALCDTLRNEELPQLGIQVEDLAPGSSVFKLLSLEEREAVRRVESDEQEIKTDGEAALELRNKQQELEMLMQIAPSDLFRKSPEFADRFNMFDTNGFPTLENGEPIKKSQRKKLAKKLAKYEKSYMKYWKTRDNGQ